MTDREQFEAWLNRVSIGFLVSGNDILLEEGKCDKVEGYMGFFAVFQFTGQGDFILVSIGE